MIPGVVYPSGSRWAYQCLECECLAGQIDCWPLACPVTAAASAPVCPLVNNSNNVTATASSTSTSACCPPIIGSTAAADCDESSGNNLTSAGVNGWPKVGLEG